MEIDDISIEDRMNYGLFDSIEETYEFIKSDPVDQKGKDSIGFIAKYMYILREYASKCNHITELGINQCNSTWAFLVTKPTNLVSIDIDLHNRPTKRLLSYYGTNIWLKNAERLAKEKNINFQAIEADTSKIEIDPTDLLFIDTEHTYECLSTELKLHAQSVRKYIILHDITLFAHQLVPAVNEFLATNTNWRVELLLTDSPGLLVLSNQSQNNIK